MMPFLGYAMDAWTVVNFIADPVAVVAAELNISTEAAALLLAGRTCMMIQVWTPNSPEDEVQLSDRRVIHLRMPYFFAHLYRTSLAAPWMVERVEEGEVQMIETTSKPGVVNVHVRVGQEIRIEQNVPGLRYGIPEVGKEAPDGWTD